MGTGVHTGNAATARTSQILEMDDAAASGMGDRATSSSSPTGKRKKTTTQGKRHKGERDTTSSLEANRRTALFIVKECKAEKRKPHLVETGLLARELVGAATSAEHVEEDLVYDRIQTFIETFAGE